MKTTLLGAVCIVLAGVLFGLLSPKGSLAISLGGLSPAGVQAPGVQAPGVQASSVEAPSAANAMAPEAPASAVESILAPEPPATLDVAPAAAAPAPQSKDARCAALTEAARRSYLSAGYATQEFASTSIAAKADKASAADARKARDEYLSALEAARVRIAAASRAQCWSRFAMEPPDLGPFTTSLPNAALASLAN